MSHDFALRRNRNTFPPYTFPTGKTILFLYRSGTSIPTIPSTLKFSNLPILCNRILNNITFYIKLCVILYMTNLATATPFIMLAHRLTTFIRRFCNLQRLTVCKIFLHFDNKHFNFIAVHRLRYKNRKSVDMRNSVTVREETESIQATYSLFFSTGIIIYLLFVLYNSFIISFINGICKILAKKEAV